MKGSLMLQAGRYNDHASSAWFDVRLCDGGVVLSLSDLKRNVRYIAVVDGGVVLFKEEVLAQLPEEERPEAARPPSPPQHVRALGGSSRRMVPFLVCAGVTLPYEQLR
jgi:hypothetical protein